MEIFFPIKSPIFRPSGFAVNTLIAIENAIRDASKALLLSRSIWCVYDQSVKMECVRKWVEEKNEIENVAQ